MSLIRTEPPRELKARLTRTLRDLKVKYDELRGLPFWNESVANHMALKDIALVVARWSGTREVATRIIHKPDHFGNFLQIDLMDVKWYFEVRI